MGRIIHLETQRDLESQEMLDDLTPRLERWEAQVHAVAVRLAADAVRASRPRLSREEIERSLNHEDLLASTDPAVAHLATIEETLGVAFYDLLDAGATHSALRPMRERPKAAKRSRKGSTER